MFDGLQWHLGFFTKDYTPDRRGFDSFYGYYSGCEDYFDHTYAAGWPDPVSIAVLQWWIFILMLSYIVMSCHEERLTTRWNNSIHSSLFSFLFPLVQKVSMLTKKSQSYNQKQSGTFFMVHGVFSAESWSISTALCVLSDNVELSSSSTVVWNGRYWAPGHGDCCQAV